MTGKSLFSEFASWHLPFDGYVVKSGDRISWRQYQAGGGDGGVLLGFTDSTTANWTTYDQNGQAINSATTQGQWMERTVDLTPFAGKTIGTLGVVTDAQTGACTWDIYYSDMAIVSMDGTVTPIYGRASAVSLQYYSSAGISNATAAAERSNTADDAEQPANSTTYYVGDQIGSTRMLLAAGGWPLSMDTYYPYGVEASPSSGPNHYKFTGKERMPNQAMTTSGPGITGPAWGGSCRPIRAAFWHNILKTRKAGTCMRMLVTIH